MKYFKYVLLVGVLALAFLGFYAYNLLFGAVVLKETNLLVYPDTNYATMVEDLKTQDLIQNEMLFSKLATKMNLANNMHSGNYVFHEGESTYDIITKLRGGLQTPVKLILNNVNFKEDLAAKISTQIALDSTEIITFLNNEKALEAIGYNTDNILCLFIPNTYEIYWNISFESFISKIEQEHKNFWTSTRLNQAKDKGLTTNEAYILASIVQKEYKFPEERNRIAGVYVNRLDKGMKLQADPTVKFALGDLSLKRILTVHTEYNHPYNTYYNFGLPPGPISMPETSTIDAVLLAEKHAYIYFCAKEDLSGYHVFNTTYNGHLATAKLYQAALNKLKIYE